MPFLRLIVKSAIRNQRRTMLTVASVAASLFLLVSLRTLVSEIDGDSLLSEQSARRVMVRHAVSLEMPLPLAYKRRIAALPSVEQLTEYQWFAAYWREERNLLILFGCDPEYVRSDPEYTLSDAAYNAFRADVRGVLVPHKLMKLYGWRVGERLTFQGTVIPLNMEMVISGEFGGPAQSSPVFHYSYYNELVRQWRPQIADSVTTFGVKVRRREDVARTARAIDDMFRNSPWPTRTESEKNFILGFTQMLGNVAVFIGSIAAAVIFAIVLVTATTMAMTVRERTGEMAILKTLGFRRHQIFALVVGEASLIAVGGGVLGMFGAVAFFRLVDVFTLTRGIIQHFNIRIETLTLGLLVALALGVVASAVPAARAANLSIVRAMRE